MRILGASILILAASTSISSANDTDVQLPFRSVGDIGSQAAEAKGPGDEPAIEVTGGDSATTSELVICDSPGISAHQYVVRGQVKYEGVAGNGYFELWNDFGEKGVYFSRSLGEWGGLKKLSGTSGWRAFELPFYAEPGMTPKRLTLNVVLPGAGKVTISQPIIVSPISAPDAITANPKAGGGGSTTANAKGPAGEPAIEVLGTASPTTTQLNVWNRPQIATHQYIVRGQVKYEGVAGDGFLELWNDFGEKGVYFSRTLGDSGGMRKLSGTSDWRTFELPFYADPGMKPQQLTLNVVLPGAGKVTVSKALLLTPLSSSGEWWTMQQAGMLGGLVGALCGVFGATIGVLAALGKLRRLTIGICSAGIILGGLSLVAGIIALCFGQPYHVYYPLLLFGLIDTVVLGFNMPNISRRFQDAEIRRIQAADAI